MHQTTTDSEEENSLGPALLESEALDFFGEIYGQKRLDYLDTFVLALLTSGSRSGYKLYKQLKSEFGTQVSFGTLYPRLRRLEKAGILLASKSVETGKRSYELTPRGLELLRTNVREMRELAEKLMQILQQKND